MESHHCAFVKEAIVRGRDGSSKNVLREHVYSLNDRAWYSYVLIVYSFIASDSFTHLLARLILLLRVLFVFFVFCVKMIFNV